MRHFQLKRSVVHVVIIISLCFITFFALAGPKGKAVGQDKISPGLAKVLEYYPADKNMELPVIVQVDPDSFHPHGAPPGLLKTKVLSLVHGFAGQMSVKGIHGLVNSPWIEYVTVDPVVRSTVIEPLGPIEPIDLLSFSDPFISAIGADQLQDLNTELPGGSILLDPGYRGSGITVAVLDSGIDLEHPDLAGRVVKRIAFTTGRPKTTAGANEDEFGHGTHVAGIIGGDGGESYGLIRGVGPQVSLLSVKVLDDTGAGTTSNVIAAIEWMIANKDSYNIQVANLSLGHPAFESYLTDPLCQAARALVDAGIVTVVSAGNLGKTADHPEIWGGISSPGAEPSVITVGAVNTQGTVTHTDDAATSFSSRGYTVPDGLFKPDLVAPGNRIPAPIPPTSYLRINYRALNVFEDYMYLSGSSMAAPFVTGTAALMLEANPDLSPTQVKTLLLLSAVKMTEPHMFEQGNGFLNAYTAVKLAEAMDVENEQLNAAVTPNWTLEGEYGPEEVVAGGAFIWDDRVFYSDLVGVTGSFWGDGVIWADNLFDPGSVIWTDNFFDPDSVIWSDFFDGVIWADFFDGVIWADDFFDPDGVIWADSVIWTDDPANSTEGD